MNSMQDLTNEFPCLGKWSVLAGFRGSIAHGTHVPSDDPNSIDDRDVMGICVPPEEYYVGLRQFGSRGTKEIKRNEWDIVVYEARKAIGLLQKGNPNMLSLLWLPENLYTTRTAAGRLLLENRKLFVGKHAYHHFVGYAHGQLHRMTHHAFKGYMGEKRKRLVEQYGYDVKNAQHLVRILRMVIEFITDGELRVQRPDAEELKIIKTGGWTLEQVKAEADRLFTLAQEAFVRSPLPEGLDRDAVSALCARVVTTAWEER